MSEQAFEALKIANRTRSRHAALRAELAALKPHEALRRAADLIENEDGRALGMTLMRLLSACPAIGVGKVRKVCRHIGVMSADRKVRDLTDRQRVMLCLTLRHPAMLWPNTTVLS